MAFDPINIGAPLTPKQQDIAARVNVGFRFDDKGTHTSRTIMFEEKCANYQIMSQGKG